MTILILLTVHLSVLGAIDPTTSGLGNTLNRNILGHTIEAAQNNPALLGVNRTPKAGLVFPLSNFSIGEWSDKLALSPFNRYWVEDSKEASALFTKILKKSFRLDGLSPQEVSERLEKKFKGGVSIYNGFSTTLLSFAKNRFGFDVTTHLNQELTIPEGPLMAIFGLDKGLKKGETLDLSDFKHKLIWATDFSFLIGLPVNIPALHEFFKLEYGAGGVAVKYVMGHSAFIAETKTGSIYANDKTNKIEADGSVTIKTAGTGISGWWDYKNPFNNGIPVCGHGIGIDIGGILYDEKAKFTINVQNLGVIFWMKDVREANYELKDKFNLYDLIDEIDEADDNNQEHLTYIADKYVNEPLKKANAFSTMLPLSLNFGYSYKWDFSKTYPHMGRLSNYLDVSANYEQQLDNGPGRSYVPRISIGAENGTLKGHLPFRIGYVFGGPEKIASAVGFGINGKHGVFNISYKAIGTPVWIPKRGMELAAGYQINWGNTSDIDKDGIEDNVDKCPSDPEDRDGFQDEDGCPDSDNDNDGLSDTLDKCPNIAEDKDSYEDEDGCPDSDNDNDGVIDSLDKCPNIAEDKDNFKDDDGCPELDNDEDGVSDSVDRCPVLKEDIDQFEDGDGCPDFDNDKDGVADSIDGCRDIPEVFNGYRDDDGCPDTLVKPTESETKVLNTKLRSINFKTGSAELLPVSFAGLDYIAKFLEQYPHLRYEIQGHTDNQGSDDFNLILSAVRAGTVQKYLISKGVDESKLIAIGYGETVPIANNNDAGGRAINRRVEFKIIETTDEYSTLKTKEAIFSEKVRSAKIKGY